MSRALFEIWPELRERLPWAFLGEFPTPVTPLDGLARALGAAGLELLEKRDDRSSPVYGGNKVRTLEALFGAARAEGATHVVSTGAFGSNHALATVLHAPRAALEPGVILFPQPRSWAALENLRVTLSARCVARALPHWSFLPWGMASFERRARRAGQRPYVMVPGGATPTGALGYVSAALELGQQVAAGLPRPETVIVGVGSTCTSAGLLLGFAYAARFGVGFRDAQGRPAPPLLRSVRVTPWPVTSKTRIVSLARRTSLLLAELCRDPSLALGARELGAHFEVTGAFLGRGYGYATADGQRALELFRDHVAQPLDTTYSAKAAAALVAHVATRPRGPSLLWATKSSVPLPPVDRATLERAAAPFLGWLRRGERELAACGELPPDYVPLC